jgi:hypothetical protein
LWRLEWSLLWLGESCDSEPKLQMDKRAILTISSLLSEVLY